MCTTGTTNTARTSASGSGRPHRVRGQRYNGLEACKIEKEIETFVENFKKKGSVLDSPSMNRPPSLESCSSSQSRSSRLSSSIYSTDDFTDDSPEKTAYLMPEIVRRYRYCSTTSDSDYGDEDYRRLFLAYKDSKKHEEQNSLSRTISRSSSRGMSHTDITETTETCVTDRTREYSGNVMGTESVCPYSVLDVAQLLQTKYAFISVVISGESVCPYSVLDMAQLLQTKYAYISGAKAKNGAPILTFPDRPNHPEPTEEEYRKIVTYLCSVPPLHETQLGFYVLIDRRQSGWGSVKTILMRFSGYFPCHIQVVFLLQPHGFFQRAFSDYRSKFKEELEYQVISVNGPSEMYEYIDDACITTDIGGTLEFDANEWTQHRSAVEKFTTNTNKVADSLSNLIKKWETASTPNDVAGTERQILDHTKQRQELSEDIESSIFHGKTLMMCIKGDQERTPLVHVTHVLAIERLLVQLDETDRKFNDYWEKHHVKLKQSLQLRQFEEDFKMYTAGVNIEWLENKQREIGDSVARVEELQKELNEFEDKALREIDQGEKMRTGGEQYIMDDHYAVDSIRPKCIELQRMCEQYRQLLRSRREILNKSHDLQERIEKANAWCKKGMDMLANQQVSEITTPEAAAKAIRDIDLFVTTVKDLKLNNPKEFRQLFDGMITSDVRASVQKVLKKIEDVQAMCSKRKEDLRVKVNAIPTHPVQPDIVTSTSRGQTTVPEYDMRRRGRQGRRRGEEEEEEPPKKSSSQQQLVEKSARLRTGAPPTSRPTQPHRTPEISPPIPKTSLPHRTPDSGQPGTSLSNTNSDNMDGSRLRQSSASTASGSSSLSDQSLETLQTKRRHVLNELIETEKTYVQQLHDILRGYYCEMENRTMQHLIPDELIGKKDILFGNLDQIYRFHHDVFLKDLQSCQDCPMKLGKCFVNRKDEFQMYSIYCANKPRSEELHNSVGNNNPFFKECQRKLGHQLPLEAYLLKPVQRITKYQLLLKEMLKYTRDDRTCQHQLEESLNTMLEVVRIVNNSMYEISIVGFPGNLSELGKLLMQGSFNVSTEHKREKIKDIRIRPMHRHLFLYEKAVLLCKRKEDTQNNDRDVFSFKNMLRCNQVGLTENIKGDRRKFELWLRGREEVYIIQAPTLEVKEFWVKEIKKVLMGQFDEIKINKLNLVQRSSEDLTRSSVDSGVESWRHRQGSGNNNISTVPIGLGMMSPETPPDPPENNNQWSEGEEDFTDSDPELDPHRQNRTEQHVSPIEPVYVEQFVAIADYVPVDDVEMGLREGDIVEVLKTGSTGWCLAHHLTTNEEGWVPGTYLDPVPNTGPRSYVSMSSIGSGSQADQTSHSSGYSATSPVDETTI